MDNGLPMKDWSRDEAAPSSSGVKVMGVCVQRDWQGTCVKWKTMCDTSLGDSQEQLGSGIEGY